MPFDTLSEEFVMGWMTISKFVTNPRYHDAISGHRVNSFNDVRRSSSPVPTLSQGQYGWYLIFFLKNEHLFFFILRFAALSLLKTSRKFRVCFSRSLPTTTMSSIYANANGSSSGLMTLSKAHWNVAAAECIHVVEQRKWN